MMRIFIILVILTVSSPLQASENSPLRESKTIPVEQVPKTAVAGLDYLIEFVKPVSPTEFDQTRLAGLIDFVHADKATETRSQLPERLEATPAYYEFEIKKNLTDILKLAYHPDIPFQMVSPGSMRFSYWTSISDSEESLPRLWEHTQELTNPVVTRGVETEEITPDKFTGAYYRSQLDRALILFSNNGHRVLVSLARQKNVSEVGQKGLILGADDQWNYFYSGEKGLTKTGLGWVDSYIYDTFSVLIYYEIDENGPQTKCCIFKWLRAGWLGMNMVKEKHIQSGFERFARDMKRVLESPRLPEPEQLADLSMKIRNLPDEELAVKMGQYLNQLEKRQVAENKTPELWVKHATNKNDYISRLSLPQMHAALFLEALKYKLGLLSHDEVAYLNLH